MLSILKKLFGTANDRTVKKLFSEITKINSFEPAIKILSDAALKNKTVEFKEKLKNGATLDDILYEAFAVVREAASRVCGMRHFDVQLIGGIILHRGMIAEMRTGEGKTLVATLPAYLNALTEKGVHVVTVNDYLALRDSASMGKIYNFLGLSVGCIVAGMTDEAKRIAYNSDITHATNNELGFDYLRDNMKYSMQERVLRPFNFAIIDEVDSILIDEARTPIVISGPVNDNSALYGKIDKIVRLLNVSDFEKDEKLKTINLTEAGITHIESLLIKDGIIKPDTGLYDFENLNLVHYVNQALRAHHMFTIDVDYLVREGKVMIIDEFTGRVMEGRRYSEGLHQALEAKENVKIQNENQTLASITFQNYFRNYPKLAGMTGTSMTEASELKDIYNLDVVAVPTHNKVTRIDLDDEIYGSKQEKYDAILKLIKDCYNRGQPILVGTISIEKSEELSSILNKEKIPHKVLNAKFHEQEAFIIAQAGRFKAVTIATNMAGRGTDIMLGGNPEMLIEQFNKDHNYVAKTAEIKAQIAEEKQKVIETGGLFVIGTERHESRRIDNQLRGRSGRQGDPGKTQFFLSLDDDLMRIFASDRISGVLRTLGLKDGEAIHHPMISRSLEKAQQKVEEYNYEMRKNLLRFDDVMNDQRKIIYEQRTEIIKSKDSYGFLTSATEELAKKIVLTFIPVGSYREDWDIENLTVELHRIFSIKFDHNLVNKNDVTEEDITKLVIQMAHDIYKSKEEAYSSELMHNAVKYILLTTLDQVWKDHLYSLDHLRQGISLRAYAQKDPLSEYKREAFNLFEQMLNNLKELFIQTVYHFHIDLKHLQKEDISLEHKKLQKNMRESREDPAFSKYNAGNSIETYLKPVVSRVDPKDRKPDDPMSWGRVSRNELCPCGSGKKYKYCHGVNE
ncbi:preprotein translocase subunit SecA [Rickettsia prowazekii]|uniref:Protein translocase subunit SecA n=2 Tax=Rickettsia prowazekii TaxID=782 RepID=SECA_RICPR|nr:preprotein translocase subunit SecA [Rickettsia prowazekii]Q9ZCX7.1 RecName: Full=Protein translocase subunit SecA [Rickettsia prowazekii str. Madrid E]ADE30112.1 Preprotein translocase secA subunit [Rickettsia prowazekii str. Rp22]AFE49377.1 preprotein translocase subunit SecA [Rickettsia prowazekii str. Chernikova]AFE50221.1 preprotein translocase subunit SecA [Rickettsia prowazekii str. Katsinyian]AFE51067.1 preprotein translocase subunit SecA [Rickettsia prowazekii str. BuV67-CWPP]AFE5